MNHCTTGLDQEVLIVNLSTIKSFILRVIMKQFIEEIMDTRLKHLRNACPSNITDLVFLEIEKSYREFYQLAVKNKGGDPEGKRTINKFIGKVVREHWDLKNLGVCNNPQSILIESYEKHSN
jgi:hypothetical protein